MPLEEAIQVFKLLCSADSMMVDGHGKERKMSKDQTTVELKRITASDVAIIKANTSLTMEL